jgi:outer membrane protein assembly factor BamB
MLQFLHKLLYIIALVFSTLICFAQPYANLMSDTIWTYSIKGYPSEVPLLNSDAVYLGADASPFVCLDKETGKEKWRLDVTLSGKGFIHTVHDHEGTVFTNGTSKNLIAMRKNDGKVLWTYECKFDDDLFSVITIADEVLYVNPLAAEFIALSIQGKLQWKTVLPDICLSYTVQNEMIYCQLSDGTYTLNRKNGKFNKIIDVHTGNRSPFPPAFIENKLLVHYHDTLTCFDQKTYRKLWSIDAIKGFSVQNNQVYAFSGRHFNKINLGNGKNLWQLEGDFAWYLQPSVFGSSVYIQTRHQFLIVDDLSGSLQFESNFPYKSYTKPLVEANRIYIGIGGKFVCVKNPMASKRN